MPIRTGFLGTDVQEKQYGNAIRYEVWLIGPLPLYTWNSVKATLCKRAFILHKAITAHTRETTWGEEIVKVELADKALPETEVA